MNDFNISQIQGAAAAIDAELAAAQAPQPAPAVVAAAAGPEQAAVQEARAIITFALTLFVPMYPSLAGIYTDEAQSRLAAVSVPLMQKYDISMEGIFAKWGPEIQFTAVAGPLLIATAQAVKADNAARAAAAKEAQNAKSQTTENQPSE